MPRGKPVIYTDEMKQFIADHQYGRTRLELAEIFNEKFGTNYSSDSMKQYCTRRKLHNGNNGYFQKGKPSHNKGKKMPPEIYEKAKATMFKPGNMPMQYRPVGSERVNVDGYVEVKVADPNKWRLKHNVIWERHHGKIPAGHVVIFLDRDRLNMDINNLMLVSRSELLIMNKQKLTTDCPELNKTAAYLAKQIDETRKAKKKLNET